jgi:hypothetical protein
MAKLKSQIAQPGPKVPISDVPEVQKVMDLKMEIDALKGEFPEAFMRFADLIDRYNTAVEDAEKVVRARGITCGPFVNSSATMKYDAKKMYDELGEELFLEVGGKIDTVTTYVVDKETLEPAIQSGKVPEETLEHFRALTRSYKVPKRAELP